MTTERIENSVRHQPGSKCQASTRSDMESPLTPTLSPQVASLGTHLLLHFDSCWDLTWCWMNPV